MAGFESPNFTQVPNDLFEKMADMNGAELKVILAIVRLTYGYHVTRKAASISELARMTGLGYSATAEGAKKAEERGLIRRIQEGLHTSEWEIIEETPLKKRGNTIKSNVPSIEINGTSTLNLMGQVGLKKERKDKEKETKKDDGVETFNIFSTYQDIMGMLVNSPYEAQQLQEMQDTLPQDWIEDAFKVAVKSNVRTLAYVQGVIAKWKEHGKGWKPGSNGNAFATPAPRTNTAETGADWK